MTTNQANDHSTCLEERGVGGVGAIQCRLAIAGHHDIKNEIVAVFVGIHPERADFIGLLRLSWIFKGKAQEGGLAVCALDCRQFADLCCRVGGESARIAQAREIGERLLLVGLIEHLDVDQLVRVRVSKFIYQQNQGLGIDPLDHRFDPVSVR
jgi:hypothetical protein